MNKEKWKTNKLEEVTKIVFSGGTPNTKKEEYWNGDLNWLSSGETRNSYITDTEKTITQLGVDESSTRLAKKGDIVIASAGQGLTRGQTSFCQIDTYINQSLISIRSDESKVHNKFIFYNIKGRYNELRQISDGHSIRGSLTTKIIKGLSITYPSFEEQKRIADILSSLDDKIEVNNKISRDLEELSQSLYKHWFIDFEFPNTEGEPYKSSGGNMIDSDLGLIPVGWKIEKLGKSSISSLVKSGINDFYDEKIYLATADVTDTTITNHDTKITFEEKPSRANMQPKENTVWFAKMKNSRKLIRVSKENNELIKGYIFSTGFAGLESKNYTNYLWTLISSTNFDDVKNNMATGTTQEAINNGVINNFDFIVPEKTILDKFEKLTNDIYNKISQNDRENIMLSEMRDLLLPKLMSGEIQVPVEED